MESKGSLPTPMGATKSATQRAKERPRQKLVGGPPVSMPNFAEVEAKKQELASKSAEDQLPKPQIKGRSPEEIKADLERLNQAAKEYNENVKSGEERPEPQEDTASQEDINKMVEQMDDFELDAYSRMLEEDMLNNTRRRKAIEKRLKPMDLSDLITEGEVQQRVPIVPGKLEVTYRSVSSGEDLEVKRMLYNIRKEVPRYQLDAYSIMSLALAIYAINGHPLPDHRDESGNFSETRFRQKFELVKKYPLQLVADLGVNYIWFDVRVKKLFSVEALGNG